MSVSKFDDPAAESEESDTVPESSVSEDVPVSVVSPVAAEVDVEVSVEVDVFGRIGNEVESEALVSVEVPLSGVPVSVVSFDAAPPEEDGVSVVVEEPEDWVLDEGLDAPD